MPSSLPPEITKLGDNGYSTRRHRGKTRKWWVAQFASIVVVVIIAGNNFSMIQLSSHNLQAQQQAATTGQRQEEAAPSTRQPTKASSLLLYSYDDYNSCTKTTTGQLGYTHVKQEAWEAWLRVNQDLQHGVTGYAQLWNYTNHSINIHQQNASPDEPLTSLEILQDILRDQNAFEMDPMDDAANTTTVFPECFVPRLDMTKKLVDCGGIRLARPILNVGFPKVGSTTLFEFFKCTFQATNELVGQKGKWTVTHDQLGKCNREAVREKRPPLGGCQWTRGDTALMAMQNNLVAAFIRKFPYWTKFIKNTPTQLLS